MPVPAATPTITKLFWATSELGALTGTAEKFTIMAEWTCGGSDFNQYDYELEAGTGDTGTIGASGSVAAIGNGGTIYGSGVWFGTFDGTLGSGAYFKVAARNADGVGTYAQIDLAPTTISGSATISANVNGWVWHPLAIGPTKPDDWTWQLSGAPAGVTITAKSDTSDGGIITGSPAAEGVYNMTVGLTGYESSNVIVAQNYPVTLHVSGERYIQDFHSTTSRRGINIRHEAGTVQSWNFNSANELELTLGESREIHAILRNGTGYLSSGVTKLTFTAKLPNRADSPTILTATAASPTVLSAGTCSAWPVTVSVDGENLRRFFAVANTPQDAASESASVLLHGQFSYTYDSKIYKSRTFLVRVFQPIS